jgi:DNA-binding SARP family transcriptional activator
MVRFQACFLGRFGIQRDGQSLERLVPPKSQELLSYLVLNRKQSHSRDALAELLWEDQPADRSRKYLRQALWRLQSSLAADGGAETAPLLVDAGWIQFAPAAECWLDVEEFERVHMRVSRLAARDLSREDFRQIRRAVELYHGNFLEGCYQDWCLIERERYQRMYIMMLDKLVQYCEVHQAFDAGLAYTAEILRFDRAYERAHRQTMRLYQNAGDRSQALRQYDRCVDALREELGVAPSERTTQLYEQIRSDHFETPGFINSAEGSADGAGLQGMLDQLHSYAEILDQMRDQVHRDIVSIESRLTTQR